MDPDRCSRGWWPTWHLLCQEVHQKEEIRASNGPIETASPLQPKGSAVRSSPGRPSEHPMGPPTISVTRRPSQYPTARDVNGGYHGTRWRDAIPTEAAVTTVTDQPRCQLARTGQVSPGGSGPTARRCRLQPCPTRHAPPSPLGCVKQRAGVEALVVDPGLPTLCPVASKPHVQFGRRRCLFRHQVVDGERVVEVVGSI